MERKVNYGYSFKLECVELVTKKYYSTGYVSKLKDIPETLIRKWVGVYRVYGLSRLYPKQYYNYTVNFKLLLSLTDMARSSFYYYHKQSKLPDKYAVIKLEIKRIYQHHKGRYGYRRITDKLQNKGVIVNHKTVMRLINLIGLKSIIRVKKYKSYRGENGKIAPNILQRNFQAAATNEKWATDVTEFNVSGPKLYLSTIIDLFNQEIISYEITESPVFEQVVMMLKKAFKKIPNDTNLMLHYDQGWQYQMSHYQHLLKEKGIIQSMLRKGNCLDNAIIENFFGTLKSELFYTENLKQLSN